MDEPQGSLDKTQDKQGAGSQQQDGGQTQPSFAKAKDMADKSGAGSQDQEVKQDTSRRPAQQPPSSVAADQAQVQPQVGRPAVAKEKEFVSGVGVAERVPIVERREPRELSEEVQGWLERVEHDDIAEPKPIVHEGKTVVSPAAPLDVKVTLPLTEEGMKEGLQNKIVDSIRWLAQWCKRLFDKYQGKVAFKIRNPGLPGRGSSTEARDKE